VFNSKRRPWIDLTVPEAEADAVAAAVLGCPTGALHFVRTDDGPQEVAASGVRATTIPNGPLLLRGDVEIVDDKGELIRRDTRIAICRCAKSRHLPFCDNSHRAKVHIDLSTPPGARPASS
jgi:CDGSH-type Zn-finger protein